MEILELREKRDHFEQKRLKESHGKTLITIRANYPGLEKRDPHATRVVREMAREVLATYATSKVEETDTKEGLMVYLLTNEKPDMVKTYCIYLEDHHELGRLADLDVRTKTKAWSRKDFNEERRKCYLCEKDAVVCTRSQTHNLKDLVRFFHDRVEEYDKAKSFCKGEIHINSKNRKENRKENKKS